MWRIPILEPRRYVSPSGEFTLQVDPSDPNGSGPSMVTVKRGGWRVWSGKRPWTLWEACIADDGTVGGAAYTKGLQRGGEFVVVLLNPRGEVRAERRVRRRFGGHEHSLDVPNVHGLFFHPDTGRFVVRVREAANLLSDDEVWWSFSVATGKQLPSYTPKGDGDWVIDARPIPATPLTMLHWWRRESGKVGATFTLIDAAGKTVWRRTLPADYDVPDDDAEDELRDEIQERGAILKTGPHTFTLRHVAAKQAVTYTVARDGAGWSVRETARTAFVPAAPRQVVFAAPEIRPTLQATLALHAPAPGATPTIRDIDAPIAAGPGRIAFLRDGDDPALVVVRDTGEALRVCRLDAIPRMAESHVIALLWRGDERFLAFVGSDPDPKRCTGVFEVDARTGAIAPWKGFDLQYLRSVAPCPGGGFVALSAIWERYTTSYALIAYDDRGRVRWKKDGGGFRDTDSPETLSSPESVTVLRDGTVAVLDDTRHTVQLFAADGRYRRTIALDRAWKRTADYPAHLFATPDGGFVVFDFPGTPSVYWMGAAGDVLRSHSLHYPGYKPLDPALLMMDHAGRLWVNNRYCLFRLDASGRADRRLGEPPAPDALRTVGALTVLDDGTILAADERTGAVHIFGAAGKWRAVCKPFTRVPEQKDRSFGVGAELESGPAGTFVIGERWFTTAGKAIARPRGFRTAGERAAGLKRRPDNTWLAEWFRRQAAAAPNGALVVADGPLNLYTANDAPVRLIPLPEAFAHYPIAYDGATIVLGGPDAVYAYAASGRPKWRFSLPKAAGRERNWTPFLVDGGRTLCLFDGVRTVYRYALPG